MEHNLKKKNPYDCLFFADCLNHPWVLHCKYIRPDYDGTLAIHSSTYYARST